MSTPEPRLPARSANPHRSWIGVVVACLALGSLADMEPAKPSGFDGARAYEHVRQLVAFGPRPAGSPALQAARQYITRQLADAGVQVTEQAFQAATPIGEIGMVNLIALIPGARADRLVVAGHYDTKIFREFPFVGANDAGSSTAFLIELARALKARKNAFSVELVFLDGEEAILEWRGTDHTYGSRYYVDNARRTGTLGQIKAMILVDMIGDRSLAINRETASTPWLADLIWASARRLQLDEAFSGEPMRVEDDHVPFLEAGIPAVDLIDFSYPPWHTAGDTLDKVSARSLQIVGDVLVGALPDIEARLIKR
jgi:glutaminyl-peptide cyclotransferase